MTLGVVGDIVQDVVVYTLAPFAPGSDTPSRIERRRGGSAANLAAAAAGLTATRFIGCVGDDRTGRELADSLPGVDVRLQITPEARTGSIAVLIGSDGERHMFPDRGANACLTSIDPSWLDGLALLHTTAYSLEGGSTASAVTDAINRAHDAGVIVSLDVSSVALIRQIGVDEFTAMVDALHPAIVFANAAEAAALGWDALLAVILLPDQSSCRRQDLTRKSHSETSILHGGRSPEQLIPLPDVLPQAGSPHGRLVFVKDGSRPALVRAPAGAWTVPTTPIPAPDTTGAGDAFAAGVLAHIVNAGMTRDDVLKIDESTAKQLVIAGHASATAWLSR